MPLVISKVLPKGIMGLFLAAVLAALITTHNSFMHSWGSVFIQDIILPFRKTHIPAKTHLWLLRFAILGVAIFVFFYSLYFKHTQRIMMYCWAISSIFIGGAGAVIIGGLYWKKGTTAAAWTSLIAGIVLGLCGVYTTQSGPSTVFAFQESATGIQLSEVLSKIHVNEFFFKAAEYIFRLTGLMTLFYTSCICLILYIVVSLLTCKSEFNMDRMLHQGKYAIKDEYSASLADAKTIWQRLGFSRDFTRSDYFIAIITIAWPIIWLIIFIIGSLLQSRFSDKGWFEYWYYWMWGMFGIGIVVTVWFTIGGFKDLKQFWQTLKSRKFNEYDDGTVRDHHNLGEDTSKEDSDTDN